MKVLFYAINGTGLGHLSRLLQIARQLRRYLCALGQEPDIQFLTTSDAAQLASEFPTYKTPSKSSFAGQEKARKNYIRQAKFFVSNLVMGFRPDVLVLDTLPEGSFREFVFLKDYAKMCVFIDRHKDPEIAQQSHIQTHLPLYDLILHPDVPERRTEYAVPEQLANIQHFVGYVHGFRAAQALSPEVLRTHFHFPENAKVAYISAGGGGDPEVQGQIQAVCEALLKKNYFLLLGYGPLYRGALFYHPQTRPLQEVEISRYFKGIDLAVSAAGYNSYHELLAAGVPTLFFAQKKGLDRQDLRIAHGEQQGYHLSLQDFSEEEILQKINALEAKADAFRERLHTRLPQTQGASRAAQAILQRWVRQEKTNFSQEDIEKLTTLEQQLTPEQREEARFVSAVQWIFFLQKTVQQKSNAPEVLEKINALGFTLSALEVHLPRQNPLLKSLLRKAFQELGRQSLEAQAERLGEGSTFFERLLKLHPYHAVNLLNALQQKFLQKDFPEVLAFFSSLSPAHPAWEEAAPMLFAQAQFWNVRAFKTWSNSLT